MAEEGMDLDPSNQTGMNSEESSMTDMDRGGTVNPGGGIWLDSESRVMHGCEMRQESPSVVPSPVEVQLMKNVLGGFLKMYRTENVIHQSQKVVCLDSGLEIQKAFFVLSETGLGGAPVWSSKDQKFIDTIAVADMVDYLLLTNFPNNRSSTEVSSTCTISSWLDTSRDQQQLEWLFVDADTSLYDTCLLLRDHDVTHLPVFCRDDNMVVQVLTKSKILRFLHDTLTKERLVTARAEQGLENVEFLDWTVGGLGIGTFKDLATVSCSTLMADSLQLMNSRRLTSLPIVDQEGKIIDVFTRYDVCELTKLSGEISADVTVQEALLRYRQVGMPGEYCRRRDTLRVVLNIFDNTRDDRLYCVNDDNQLEGEVSLKDILRLFLD